MFCLPLLLDSVRSWLHVQPCMCAKETQLTPGTDVHRRTAQCPQQNPEAAEGDGDAGSQSTSPASCRGQESPVASQACGGTSFLQESPEGSLGLRPSSQPICHQCISFPPARGLFIATSGCLGFPRHQ